jgi:hypothetical protein
MCSAVRAKALFFETYYEPQPKGFIELLLTPA